MSRTVLALSVAFSGAAIAAGAADLAALENVVSTQIKAHTPVVDVACGQLKNKADLGLLSAALINAGVKPGAAVAALITCGADPAQVTSAVIAAAGVGSAKEVVAAATAVAPNQAAQITGAAVLAGADATSLPATAAGPAGAGAAGVNAGTGPSGPTLNSPSFGGGGGGAASRS